jgi:hypothetical protein
LGLRAGLEAFGQTWRRVVAGVCVVVRILRRVRVALVTCSALREGSDDEAVVASLIGAEHRCWDDSSVDWEAYDRVVIRSTWDYTWRVGEFLAWCSAVGPKRLRNPPDLVAFNVDKRYLLELGVEIVPTVFVAPGEAPRGLAGELVVKPNISAGARDTGRFGPETHAAARALIERIQASGRTALVQPYLVSVDQRGETALVFLGGDLSHVLRKRAILAPDGVAPPADGALAPAAAMLRKDLVTLGAATPGERALAHQVMRAVSERFGTPLYARVDLVTGPQGRPLLLELEVIEPALYLDQSPGAAQRLADAIQAS